MMSAAALVGIQTISAFASISPCPKVLPDTTPFASVLARVEDTRFRRKSVVLWRGQLLTQDEYFHVQNGKVTETSVEVAPAAVTDRLYLVNASGLEEFRPVYEAFSQMGFYSLNLDKIRDLQAPDPGDLLIRDGSNLASVLARLSDPVKRTH